ncbi:hypothetical protein K505DRAFT_378133 [Melanomma pulvis-pyrius CBS 109.77]|uniref:Uncharacterized protein n=1 Tax=Melanomma pulvis-pyrius CBS 109.77 TaxID=1314802 RepID=A0A6A6X0X0_9PLEO|nr:hypothetical protein K505DRAFT_378133 [Melanomma pulvis-pyrius CBS 109.77]
MPLPKRQTVPKTGKALERPKTGDNRFANFQSDPRFRLPAKKDAKKELDPRFARLQTDPDFHNQATVDKYGRRIAKVVDEDSEDSEEDDDEDDEQKVAPQDGKKKDRAIRKELARADKRGGKNHDPIRDGGFSSSSESSSDDEDEEVEDQAELAGQDVDVPMGDVSSRLAAVNMDWDNIRATDILAVANSFVPAGGKILSVVIYPSEFGMERLQREELEGPPREIFASSSAKNENNLTSLVESAKQTDSEDDEQTNKKPLKESNGEEFDSTALRAYQLDRLRYYYAVITCSAENVAKALYDNMDGMEYLSSANFFDLRFVPNKVTFDEDPHEHCEKLPDSYKPNEFTTGALTHSKVTLTWDADDTTRQEAQKRAFSRKEVDENELQAYLGTDSSSSEDEDDGGKAAKAASLRAALGLDPSGKSSSQSKSQSLKRERDFKKPESEMQVTFSAALSTNPEKGSVFENEPPVQETTLEKYVRKQKERKARRKEKYEAVKEGRDPNAEDGDEPSKKSAKADVDEEDPWNDPFFEADPAVAKAAMVQSKKAQRAQKREEREKQEAATAAERANLELLMIDDDGSKVQHFNMNEIAKAEKAKKKGKKKSKIEKETVVEDNFKINVEDPRFAKLYESHEFAIDPTNPKFKGTPGMKALLEEGRKKRKHDRDGEGQDREQKKSKKKDLASDADDLKKLAARVKAKSKKT